MAPSSVQSHSRMAVDSPQTKSECGFKPLDDEKIHLKQELLGLTKLSLPVIVTYVLEYLPGVVSVALVGQMDTPLAKEYVDGVSLSNMFTNLSGIAVGFGLATALDTLCSQAHGAGRSHNMGIYFQSGLLVMVLAMVPIFFANWYTEDIMLLFGMPHEVAQLAGRFSRVSLPGIMFRLIYELVKKVLLAQGIVKPIMFVAIFSNVVNLALGVYLTSHTSLGFDGAAIARAVSAGSLLVGVVPFFVCNPTMLTSWWGGWCLRDALRHIHTFLKLGLPGMFMIMLEWWSFEVISIVVGLLPDSIVALSVHSVLVNVSNITFNFFMGIAVATSIRVGNYVGSNQPKRVRLIGQLGMLLSFLVTLVLAVVIAGARHVIPRIFIDDDTSTTLAAKALLILLPFQLVDAFNCVIQGIFRGTGRQTFAAVVNLFAHYGVGLPLGVVLAFPGDLGVQGCWVGFTCGIACALLASLVKLHFTDWQELADAARERTLLVDELPSPI